MFQPEIELVPCVITLPEINRVIIQLKSVLTSRLCDLYLERTPNNQFFVYTQNTHYIHFIRHVSVSAEVFFYKLLLFALNDRPLTLALVKNDFLSFCE